MCRRVKCEDASREEFPAITEPSQIPGLPEAAMSGLEGSVAKTFASVILPARSESAVSGHKGSVASADAEVEVKTPARSEAVMLSQRVPSQEEDNCEAVDMQLK